jgi:hypothetical protein
MSGYLLSEEHFTALKEYIGFLNDLPVALEEIGRFSGIYRNQGHQLLTPPNAQSLADAALGNKLAWQALMQTISSLGESSAGVLKDSRRFIDEFRHFTQGDGARRKTIDSIDPQRFTLTKSPVWAAQPARDVIDLMRELCRRLYRCASLINAFQRALTTIGASVHGIFVRFIDSLSLPLCSCDGPIPKIEAYYAIGKIGLPNLQYQPGTAYSQNERMEFARDHLAHLRRIRIKTSTAVDCLNDFCHVWQKLLTHAQVQLQNNHLSSSWSRSNRLLTFVDDPLNNVKDMSDRLIRMSRKFQA